MTEITRPNGKTYKPRAPIEAVSLWIDDEYTHVLVLGTTDPLIAEPIAVAELARSAFSQCSYVLGGDPEVTWLRAVPRTYDEVLHYEYVEDDARGRPAVRWPVEEFRHPCGDWPAPCNCDDPETHDGAVRPEEKEGPK